MRTDTEVMRWRRGTVLALAIGASLTHTAPLTAQTAPPHVVDQHDVEDEANPIGAVVGGLAGGALGFFGGAYLGASGDCYEICRALVVGAISGQALGVPLGAHLGNGGRGNLAATMGVSLLSVGVGIMASHATSNSEFYVVSMVLQVAAVTTSEIMTSPNVSVSAGPSIIDKEPGVAVSIRW